MISTIYVRKEGWIWRFSENGGYGYSPCQYTRNPCRARQKSAADCCQPRYTAQRNHLHAYAPYVDHKNVLAALKRKNRVWQSQLSPV